MAWDDELDQLVTKVRDALAQVVPGGTVVDFCGLRSARFKTRAVETAEATGSLPAVEPISPDVHDSMAVESDAHVIDLCGLGVPIRLGHDNLGPG
ncbi:MAG TPA: hypothetical protein VM818_13935 [Vicinamibacterales bacterium]|jgi:hypothetical protein|nr:hypothetical protein [Vicinamibacterales bacterium]